MLIRLGGESDVAAFCLHFIRAGFEVEPVGGVMVEVRRPDAPSTDQEALEIRAHLTIWHITNPESDATPVD